MLVWCDVCEERAKASRSEATLAFKPIVQIRCLRTDLFDGNGGLMDDLSELSLSLSELSS